MGAAIAVIVGTAFGPAQSLTLGLPDTATPAADRRESLTSYALPTGPFSNGLIPSLRVEGPLTQTAWRIDTPGQTTLEILAPLRDQLRQAGFTILFECDTVDCGGFDFRYKTSVLPEPEMHVDLGDFRFLSARRGDEAISLMVSRSSQAGFVQMTHVGQGDVRLGDGSAPVLTAATKGTSRAIDLPRLAPDAATALPAATAPTQIGPRLLAGGSVALDDLVFASGTSSLSEGAYASLTELAAWLRENPALRVALVGHTDASGGLEGNIALSRKRAQSVRERLIAKYAIPAQQIEAEGVGYLSPRASNLTEEGRHMNRRVEVIMTSTQVTP
jgi:OOP family OmpA-OmpF porin